MKGTTSLLMKELPGEEGHIFYSFQEKERYIENAITYITSGVEQGSCVLLIENDRYFSLLRTKLESLLTKEQLKRIHHVNNYDFYYSRGDFHLTSIISYFSKIIGSYRENNLSIRTWAHVEWGDTEEISCEIKKFEEEANKAVSSMKLLSVCAYDADRLTESLQRSLTCSHNFVMTDEGIIRK